MAAPTNAAYVKKALANSEPSTHGTKRTNGPVQVRCPECGHPIVLAPDYSLMRMETLLVNADGNIAPVRRCHP
jgi:hypothetical protein